ncbi:MAG: hypothetical protein ACI81Y_000757 [Glaciecola sp.]|jgi:hypothetical protein
MFSDTDDGLKTYYNFQWHVNHDNSYVHLDNMNYPYGEFMLYEDSMPFYSTITKLISEVFPGIGNYSVGIINLFFFLSLLIGAIFIFLILEYFLVSHYLASIGALVIILLSSQSLLLNPPGHFGLTYCAFFPIGFYLLIRFLDSEKKSFRWSFFIATNILVATFTHVYLGFILIFFTLASHGVKFIFERKFYTKNPKIFITALTQVFVPAIIILILYKLFDTHPDRIILPLTTEHSATLKSIFFSDSSPFAKVYGLIINIDNLKENSWSNIGNYLGLATNLILLSVLLRYILSLFSKKISRKLVAAKENLIVYMIAAFLVLTLSLGVHTELIPPKYFDIFPILKQFSSLGRFAWAFYYTISIFSIVVLHRWVQGKKFGSLVLFIVFAIFFIEIIPMHRQVAQKLLAKNVFLHENIPPSKSPLINIDPEKFQAILPLPDFYKSGIPFCRYAPDSTVTNALISSIHTGLPLMSTYLARPSVSEALNIYKMTLPWPYQKLIPQVMDSQKDIALIFNHCDATYLTDHEKLIIKNARLVSSSNLISVFAISPEELANIDTGISSKEFSFIRDSLFHKHEFIYSDSNAFVYHDDFENGSSKISYRGSASFVGKKEKYNVVAEIETSELNIRKTYSLSFWYYNHVWDQTFNSVIIEEKDAQGQTIQWISYSPLTNKIIDGWWYLSEHDFAPKTSNGIIKVLFKGEDKFEDWFAIDNLLIRLNDMNVYQIKNDIQLFQNNVEIPFH